MVEKDTILKEKLRYVGVGDFKGIYEYAYNWLKDAEFNVIETAYSEKISGSAKDVELKWIASKKITDYFKIVMTVKWKILAMTDVEVERDGKKLKMNKFAELTIDVAGTLEKDYSNKWGHNSFQTFLKDTYHKFVIPQRLEQKEDQVRDEVQLFKDEMRSYLELSVRR